jgi:NAD(P)-dependent dehydrogenase (short-subunit alcohol dehydrogenase family)
VKPPFSGKVALVTGGASGIGLACVKRLKRAGARVAVIDRDEKQVAKLRRTLPACDLYPTNVANATTMRNAVSDLLARHGRLDFLVLCAGICRDAVLWKMNDLEWKDVIDVNLTGPANLLRSTASHLRAQRSGRVVLVSSINGQRGKFGQSNYAASKAALLGLARSAARELGPTGVTVNVVAPGFTETPMTAGLADAQRDAALAATPLGRLGTADDVAGAVMFFLGPDAAHVTGQLLAVDGGQGMG